MQATIKARRVNNHTTTIGTHLTVTRVVNDYPDRIFGFGMTDDGREVYIPATVIKAQQMTEHDVGAGLTGRLIEQTGYVEGKTHPLVNLPVQWDGEAEEIVVDVSDPIEQPTPEGLNILETEFSKLAEGCDEMVLASANDLTAAVDHMKAMEFRDAIRIVEATRDKLEAFRSWIDEMAPSDGD